MREPGQPEHAGSKRDLAIPETLRATGLRVGELCALELGDIAISEREGQLIVRSGKGSEHRVVLLNADVRHALEAYLQVRPKLESRSLFVGTHGGGIGPQAGENLVKKYARLANFEGVSPHTVRHTAAESLLDAGVDLVSVSTLLGPQRLETTAIYTTPSQRDLEQAVARLERER